MSGDTFKWVNLHPTSYADQFKALTHLHHIVRNKHSPIFLVKFLHKYMYENAFLDFSTLKVCPIMPIWPKHHP